MVPTEEEKLAINLMTTENWAEMGQEEHMYDSEGDGGRNNSGTSTAIMRLNEKTLRQKPVTEISCLDLKVDLERIW